MGFGLFYIFILLPLTAILLVLWIITKKKQYGKTLLVLWAIAVLVVIFIATLEAFNVKF